MNKLLVSLLLTLGLTGLAHAAGDAAAGQAKAAVCGACHGADGNSPAPNFPKLAGQGERYLLKQMHDIKDGKRTVLEMTGRLTNLSDQDLADIAAYFASQKMSVGMADPNLVAQGEALFRGGKIAAGMPACPGCHSPSGVGIATAGFPHLGGQPATYVATPRSCSPSPPSCRTRTSPRFPATSRVCTDRCVARQKRCMKKGGLGCPFLRPPSLQCWNP